MGLEELAHRKVWGVCAQLCITVSVFFMIVCSTL